MLSLWFFSTETNPLSAPLCSKRHRHLYPKRRTQIGQNRRYSRRVCSIIFAGYLYLAANDPCSHLQSYRTNAWRCLWLDLYGRHMERNLRYEYVGYFLVSCCPEKTLVHGSCLHARREEHENRSITLAQYYRPNIVQLALDNQPMTLLKRRS